MVERISVVLKIVIYILHRCRKKQLNSIWGDEFIILECLCYITWQRAVLLCMQCSLQVHVLLGFVIVPWRQNSLARRRRVVGTPAHSLPSWPCQANICLEITLSLGISLIAARQSRIAQPAPGSSPRRQYSSTHALNVGNHETWIRRHKIHTFFFWKKNRQSSKKLSIGQKENLT